jgi:hypothetical protein
MKDSALATLLLSPIPPQLVPALKALKLGGMLESLSVRLDQAQQQRLGYAEFRSYPRSSCAIWLPVATSPAKNTFCCVAPSVSRHTTSPSQ